MTERSFSLIKQISIDSRQSLTADSVFVALQGEHFDGHSFIPDLLKRGVRNFIVSEDYVQPSTGNYIQVKNTLKALQELARDHREQFKFPVVGITGSNAKTIIKEWIFQLLSDDFSIVKSPKSYNSQVGVPLSIFQMDDYHNFGVFEAGISTVNEMKALGEIIQPNIGIFTNIGSAHSEGFASIQEKINEKLKLFSSSDSIIYCNQHQQIKQAIELTYPDKQVIAWSMNNGQFEFEELRIDLSVYSENFVQENLGHCIALLHHLGIEKGEIKQKIERIRPIPHRLQLLEGKHQSLLINDSYNNDFAGLEVALQFAKQQANNKPITLVLSDFEGSHLSKADRANKIVEILSQHEVRELIGIGSLFKEEPFSFIHQDFFIYNSVQEFLTSSFSQANKTILIKGARSHQFERIIEQFQQKNHDTVWEISLSALVNNLNVFRSQLNDGVKLMVMVKALAYGTSAEQVAQLLQYLKVDYLGVAYPEEGKQLREAGIKLPILVLNSSETSFATAVKAELDISIYSIRQFEQFIAFCNENNITNYPIHLKLDTGMHRLGFEHKDLQQLIPLLHEVQINIKGIFSHLSVADDENFDSFTIKQQKLFDEMVAEIIPHCNSKPILHLLNSSGITHSALSQYDMVRLGIGLYGISSNSEIQEKLIQVGVLKSTISQIKEIKAGDHVGYAGAFIAEKAIRIGTISIGYADGYDRRFGNGVGEVLVNGQLAKTVGNICMDMMMIDLTNIEANAGDEVIITSEDLPITQLAKGINTIPYELLTDVSPRIPRRFVYD